MSKKKPAPLKVKREKIAFGGKLIWVIDNLTEQEKEHADEINPTPAEITDFLMACVDNGIDVKCSWDTYSECYQAVAIGSWHGYPSQGYATSGRSGSSISDALLMLFYRIQIKAEFNLSSVKLEVEQLSFRG